MKKRYIALLLLVLIVAGGWWTWRRLRTAPAWYRPPDPASAAVSEQAERMEYGTVVALQKVRPAEEEWTLELDEAALNAWLSARLPEWIAHREGMSWPPELGTPQVRIVDGRLDLATPVTIGGTSQVLVAKLVPELQPASIHVELVGLGVGGLPLPGAASVIDMLRGRIIDAAGQSGAGAAVRDFFEHGLDFARLTKLGDDRRVEIIDVAVADGRLQLRCRTLPKFDTEVVPHARGARSPAEDVE